jgi:predicted TPR repeat methyltransferase
MSAFGEYSSYYDLLNQGKDYREEVSYVRHLIDKYHPHGKTVLELGCGTGIHAALLQQRGLHVTGIDKSAEMLKIARSKLNGSDLKFIEGDILDFRTHHRFDIVVSLFHVMSYMNNTGDLRKAFDTAGSHLESHGLFIFDCWHGPAVMAQQPHIRTRRYENAELLIERTSHPEWLREKNTVNVRFEITISDKKSSGKKNISELHPMRYWFSNEIEESLNHCGFELLAGEEWLSAKELDEESWNACYIARKLK